MADRPLPDLPVVETFPALRRALAERGTAVLVAPPGAGKTTLVPLALLDEPWLGDRKIVVLEPRRLATRAAARRMAQLLGTDVGGLVGYQTRDERHLGPDTRIEVVTEGILTRRLQSDPELPGVGLVVFDEVHERNLPTDIGLAFALDARATLRPDLRILAMSATPDTEALVTSLGDAPVIESEGRMFPVDLRWAPRDRKERIEPAIVRTVLVALRDQPGDVLVFLPGIGEIRRVQQALEEQAPADVDVRPLAGALSMAEQDQALEPSPAGRRRVVLSTDIAETSLTVEGVRVVVDSGLARAPRFDARTGMTRLTTISTSRASAEQRAGRAGRVEPGACYRLWSKIEHGSRPAHRSPEITEVDLARLALELAAWGTPADELAFPTPPPTKAMRTAHELLTDLEALDDDGRLTDIGRMMLGLPVHPRLARMLVSERSPLGCALAVLLDERDVLRGRPDDLPSDLGLRLRLLAGRGGHDHADRRSVDQVRRRADDLARRIGIRFDTDLIDPDRAGLALLHAYPDRLAMRRRPGQFQLRTGSGAWLPDDDPLAHEAFIVAADLDGKRDRARVRLAAGLDAEDVALAFGDDVIERVELVWDADRDDLVERVERRLGGMQLGAVTRRPSPGEATTAALMERVRSTGLAVLGWSGASIALRQRVEFLHRAIGDPWPDWSVDTLTDTVDEWLAPYLPGAVGRADLERADLTMVLRSQLPWPTGADLDELAPSRLELPTGRTVAIDYTGDEPAASVRVQDLFGTTVHPTAGGRPIVLSLLSPADRPVQVTADLPGFWTGSWADVKKDLAGRYPKHRWPDDPGGANLPPAQRSLMIAAAEVVGVPVGLMVLAMIIVLVGAATQASIGVGLGLLAAPTLSLIDPAFIPGALTVAMPPLVVGMAWREREHIDRTIYRAVPTRFIGSVAGAVLVARQGEQAVAAVVGVAVLLAVVASLTRLHFRPTLRNQLLAGTASGFAGTVAGVGGPPMAITYQHTDPRVLRASLAAFNSIGLIAFTLPSLAIAGVIGRRELACFLVPGVIAGLIVGKYTIAKLPPERVRPFVLAVCAGSALLVLGRTLA